jgi:hypothetical protein
MGYELETIWKEVVMAQFKVLSWHLPGGTEKTTKACHGTHSPGQNLNLGLIEHESGQLTTRL